MNCYFMRKCTGDKEQKHFGLLKGINTKLIPTSALMRKKINHISSPNIETGEVVTDHDGMCSVAKKNYEHVFVN